MNLHESNMEEYVYIAYNKALYMARNSLIYDNLELKYVNSNYEKVKEYILSILKNNSYNPKYSYQFKVKKKDGSFRPIYVDDFINDIISTMVVISNALEVEKSQNDLISFGNRVENDMEKPYVFKLYFIQFYEYLKYKEMEHIVFYNNYFKIDLKKCYNHINHKKLMEKLNKYPQLKEEWVQSKLNNFIVDDILDTKPGCGLQQNSPLGHVLANLYLDELDKWFVENFKDAKLLRYVDDIEIFSKNQKEGEVIVKKCENFLEKELFLKVNNDKSEEGNSFELIMEKNSLYFDETNVLTKMILRSLYKINHKNFEKFKINPELFLTVYQKCLRKIGINLSKEWLNIKLIAEEETYEKINSKFYNKKAMIKWIKYRKIYDVTLEYGDIPLENSQEAIDEWARNFVKNNIKFIEQLLYLRKNLENKINEILTQVRENESNFKKYKGELNYTLNKIKIFKCGDIKDFIKETVGILNFVNKSFLSNYSDAYEIQINELRKNNKDNHSYEYIMAIWLLGEYGCEDCSELLEKTFLETWNKEDFVNTLCTESLLKIDKLSNGFLEKIKSLISNTNNYFAVRNILFLLNPYMDVDLIIKELDISNYCERTKMLLDWVISNKNINVINIVEEIDEVYKKEYLDFPEGSEYCSL